MSVEKIRIELTGTAALLMHNERLANPFDAITKSIAAITSKRQRQTDEDRLAVQRLEWEGGLYWNPRLGPFIPGANLKKCFVEAARIHKSGAAMLRAMTPLEGEIPLRYTGPRNVAGLWDAEEYCDVRSVKLNGKSKVLRARPKFETWALTATILLENRVMSADALRQYVTESGLTTGLGDYRPTFGRFTATVALETGAPGPPA